MIVGFGMVGSTLQVMAVFGSAINKNRLVDFPMNLHMVYLPLNNRFDQIAATNYA